MASIWIHWIPRITDQNRIWTFLFFRTTMPDFSTNTALQILRLAGNKFDGEFRNSYLMASDQLHNSTFGIRTSGRFIKERCSCVPEFVVKCPHWCVIKRTHIWFPPIRINRSESKVHFNFICFGRPCALLQVKFQISAATPLLNHPHSAIMSLMVTVILMPSRSELILCFQERSQIFQATPLLLG